MQHLPLSAEVASARILMVDDEPTNLKLADAMLRTAGYQNLVMVQDPRLTLDRYHEARVDLIVLDLNMPHLDGYGLMAQLTALNDPLLPPILVLTAQGSRDHLLQALQAGARDFVAKPFDRTELLLRVRNLIEAQLAHRQLFDQHDLLEQKVQARTLELVQEVDQRRKAQAEQLVLLQEKEGLLREIHHRVKNNLQVISSLLRLEGGRIGQDQMPGLCPNVMQDMQGRIRAMGLLHESLYRTGTFASVNMATYLRQLAVQSFRAVAPSSGLVRLELNLASTALSIDQAGPCGLLVNELVSNALKHGFPQGRAGEVRIELAEVDDSGVLKLRVSDTGIGLPEDMAHKRAGGLGLTLAGDLARQVGGALEVEPGPSAAFHVLFRATPLASPHKMP